MNNLPQELVDLIVDQLYFQSADSLHWRQALTRCSMSSSRFRTSCLRWLFRSVPLGDGPQRRNLASFRELIMSSPRLVALIRELEVRHYFNIQLSLLQQVLSDLPRLQSLLLDAVGLRGAPTAMKPIPLRNLYLKRVITNDDITLNTLLGLFSGIEHFTLQTLNLATPVDRHSGYPEPRLQLKQLSLFMLVTTSMAARRAKDILHTMNYAVASCTTLRACLSPLCLAEWGTLISSVGRSIVNLEFLRLERLREKALQYDLLNLGQCSSLRCAIFSDVIDLAPVVELLRRLPLANITHVAFQLRHDRKWTNDGALQPLRAVGVLLARAAALESVAIVWGAPPLAQVNVPDAEVKEVEEGVRLALSSLDERRRETVEWWAKEPSLDERRKRLGVVEWWVMEPKFGLG